MKIFSKILIILAFFSFNLESSYYMPLDKKHYKNNIIIDNYTNDNSGDNNLSQPPVDLSGIQITTYRSYWDKSTVRAQNIVNLAYDETLVYAYAQYAAQHNFNISSGNVFTFYINSSTHGNGVFNGYVFEGIPNLSGVSNIQYQGANIPVSVENGILYFNLAGINPSITTITMQLEFTNNNN